MIEKETKLGKIYLTLFLLIIFSLFGTNLITNLNTAALEELSIKINDFMVFFRSIIIQSFPYLILGIFISSFIGSNFHLVAFSKLKKIFNKLNFEKINNFINNNLILKHFYVSLFGFLMPVCECGNIPVARRLLMQNFTVSQTITFLLAAPIINPITIFSTYIAFPDNNIVIYRILSALIISNIIGILIHLMKNQMDLLTPQFYNQICEIKNNDSKGIKHFLNNFQKEFSDLFLMLIIGSFIASFIQVFISRDLIISIGTNPLLGVVSFQTLAFIISVCSSVDSFIALAYSNSFTIGSIVSYLLFGPMIDLKILVLLKNTFKIKTLLMLTTLVFLFSTFIGLLINYFFI